MTDSDASQTILVDTLRCSSIRTKR